MSERAKLDFSDLPKASRRSRPDLNLLRQVGEEHGFTSRDPAPSGAEPDAGEPGPTASAPVASPGTVATPAAAVDDPLAFRRRGRPPSNRLIPMNVKVSPELARKLYDIREADDRRTLADVLELLMRAYERQSGQAID